MIQACWFQMEKLTLKKSAAYYRDNTFEDFNMHIHIILFVLRQCTKWRNYDIFSKIRRNFVIENKEQNSKKFVCITFAQYFTGAPLPPRLANKKQQTNKQNKMKRQQPPQFKQRVSFYFVPQLQNKQLNDFYSFTMKYLSFFNEDPKLII